MSPNEPLDDAPQREPLSFDDAFDALGTEEAAPPEGTPAEGQPDRTPTEARDSAPAASSDIEPDDDDEALPLDRRFARSQRREQKIRQEADTARQQADAERRRVLSFQGNLAQEKARREAAEAERGEFERLVNDANARRDADFEAAIRVAPDVRDETGRYTKAEIAQAWDLEKREREVVQKEQRQQLQEKIATEQSARVKQEQIGLATDGVREHVVSSLVGPMEEFAAMVGLPTSELADIRATLNSRPMRQMFARMGVEEIHAYRNELGEGIFEEIAQRAQAHKNRQAGQNRQEAKQVYRAEQPIGQGGGGDELEDLKGLDFDQAFDANARNQRRLRGERVSA